MGPDSNPSPLKQEILRGGTVSAPHGAEWYIIAPAYNVTKDWIEENLSLSPRHVRALVDGSNGLEQTMVASGRKNRVETIEHLPWNYKVSELLLLYPGDKLSVSQGESVEISKAN